MKNQETIADVSRIGYVGAAPKRAADAPENNDWYTPHEWTAFARQVLDGIDLDPFTSAKANERVRAKRFFTIDDNAMAQSWDAGTVWMNPPYSRGLCAQATTKFLEEWREGKFNAGLILVNNMTDTRWFRDLLDECSALCNLTGRISFENGAGQRVSGNTRGQTLFVFDRTAKRKHVTRFKKQLAIKGQLALGVL